MEEQIECILCGPTNPAVVFEENGYRGMKCSICHLISTLPRPAFSEMLQRYADDRATVHATSLVGDETSKRWQARHTLSIIKNHKRHGSILEIGAGAGYFLDEARRQGYEVYGIEVNRIEADFINRVLGIVCDTQPLDKSSFEGKTFDIVYHCNVLSHFYNPVAEFHRAREKMNDGGLIVFETGNLGDVAKRYYHLFSTFECPDHLYFFGEKSLIRLLQSTGFELVRMRRYPIWQPLLAGKLMKGIREAIRSGESPPDRTGSSQEGLLAKRQKPGLKEFLKRSYRYLSYLSVYRMGRFLPKGNLPQTIIVVARKR